MSFKARSSAIWLDLPRFGLIRSLRAIRDIKKGDEVTKEKHFLANIMISVAPGQLLHDSGKVSGVVQTGSLSSTCVPFWSAPHQVWLQWMRKTKKDDAAIQRWKPSTTRSWLPFFLRYIDRQYELQGYRIPLPESEELCVPEPEGVDLEIVPAEYLTEDLTELITLFSQVLDRGGSEWGGGPQLCEREGGRETWWEREDSKSASVWRNHRRWLILRRVRFTLFVSLKEYE